MLPKNKVIPKHEFALRLVKYALFCLIIVILSLLIGVLGYHYLADLSWIDSFYNASMILTGMGPVNKLETDAAKLFSSFYALFSGIAFLTTVAIFIAPIAHRILTLLHFKDFED